MIEKNFREVFDKFELRFFRKIFDLVREREGSLSAMEAFSLEVIDMLDSPTVGQFADFLNISQSNATYKVNSLMKKGISSGRIPPWTAGSTTSCSRKSITAIRTC